MADHSPSPAAQAIRAAVDAVFASSPVPPTTEEVAAAVLRALADHRSPAWDGGPLCHWSPSIWTRRELRHIAAELEGSTFTSSTH